MKKLIAIGLMSTLACLGMACASAGVDPAFMMSTSMPPDSLMMMGMAGMIIDKSNLNAAYRGFNTAFQAGFKKAESYLHHVAMVVTSTGKGNNYSWFGEFPELRKWIGDRQIKSLEKHGFYLDNEKFESTIAIKRDDFEDGEFAGKDLIFQDMGHAAKKHPDKLVYELLPLGFETVCYDGQYFFDTDHPVGETSVSNMQAGAGNPWFLVDDSRPFKGMVFQKRRDYDFKAMTKEEDEAVFMREEYRYGVDARVKAGFALWQLMFGSKATLDQTNFDAAMESMMAVKSDSGNKLGVKATMLLCGGTNRAAAKAIIEKEYLANMESNTNYKAVELVIVPWLD